jgi:hypothetical protein
MFGFLIKIMIQVKNYKFTKMNKRYINKKNYLNWKIFQTTILLGLIILTNNDAN